MPFSSLILRTNHLVWFVAASLALASVLPAACVLRESLWIDELHTSWVVTSSWQDLPITTTAGNQSLLYFAFLKVLATVLPLSPVTLRIPSLLAWWLAMTLAFRLALEPTDRDDSHKLAHQPSTTPRASSHFAKSPISISLIPKSRMSTHTAMVGGIGALWLLLDWSSWFYASEARPYAFVVAAIACMAFVSSRFRERPTQCNWQWSLFAALAVHLHLTAMLVVAAHWSLRAFQISTKAFHRKPMWRARFFELVIFLLATSPLLTLGTLVWDRRRQWDSLSGTIDWSSAGNLLPILPWLAIPWLGLLAGTDKKKSQPDGSLWIMTALLPLGLALLLTWSQLAPLLLSRYLIGSSWFLFLGGLSLLQQMRSTRAMALVGLMSCLMMVWLQGNWESWKRGEWMGWPRQENWALAIETINREAPANATIYLAPDLVETASLPDLPTMAKEPSSTLTPLLQRREYLLFPLHGLYRLRADLRCQVLPNDPTHWRERITTKPFLILSRGIPWDEQAFPFPSQYFGSLLLGQPPAISSPR